MKLNNKYLICFLLLFLTVAVMPAFSASTVIDVNLLPEMDSLNNAGCLYAGYSIENKTNTKISVEMVLKLESRENSHSTAKKVELGPHETKEEYIYCANTTGPYRSSGEINFYVDGIREYHEYVTGRRSTSYSISVLLDNKISNIESDKLFAAKKKYSYGSNSFTACYYKNNVELLPTNWIAYSQYEMLMYYDSTFKSMPEAVQNAIMDYVRAGGNLVIIGDIGFPEDLRNISGNLSVGIVMKGSLGFGGLMYLKNNIFDYIIPYVEKEQNRSYSNNRRAYRKEPAEVIPEPIQKVFKGNIKAKTESESANKTKPKIEADKLLSVLSSFVADGNNKRFSEDDFRATNVLNEYRDKYDRMASHSLLGYLVIFFAIVLGPLNYWILNKYDKKILVFVTTPVIALICCLLVFGYDLIFEAWRFDIFRQSVTILYQEDNTAITSGGEVFISGRSRNNCLEFPLGSVVIPYTSGREFETGGSLMREVRLENVQKYTENWIRAKKPLALAATTVKQSRARLEIKNVGNSIEVLNGLGADAKDVYVVSDDGQKEYYFSKIKSGAVARPDRTERYAMANSKHIGFSNNYSIAREVTKDILKAGEYTALLETDPFMAQEIDSKATIRELGCVVIGKYKGNRK